MFPLGLSAIDQGRFFAALCSTHAIRIRVTLLDLNHNLVGEATGVVLSGQVDFDTTQEVTRSARLDLLDPDNSLGLDAGNPASAGFYVDRLVQIHYGIRSDALGRWIEVPIFTGPVTSLARDGDTISVEAHGKESLMMTAGARSFTYPKGTPITTIIQGILANAGEKFSEIPNLPNRSTAATVIYASEPLWPRLQGWVRALGMVCAYDGRGYATLRKPAANPVFNFIGGDGGALLGVPSVKYQTTELLNQVIVTGGTPKGAKKRVQAIAYAPASHPLAGPRIGRGGIPRYLRRDIDDDSIPTLKAAQLLADQTLAAGLTAGMDVSFEALPIPHIEPGDPVRVITPEWSWPTVVQQATIPLTEATPMTIGRAYSTRAFRR